MGRPDPAVASAAGDPGRREWRMLVDGRSVGARSARTYAVENPSRGAVAAVVPDAAPEDVEAAVDGAQRAAAAWRDTAPRDRAALVRTLAAAVREHAAELAALDALNGGIPIRTALSDVAIAVDQMGMFADWAMMTRGEVIPISADGLHYTRREPYGVVARIIPFNHPLMFAATKIAAPLVAGNCVVLKLPDQAPLSGLRLGEIAAEVLPPGVLSVISGSGPASGDALVRHPAVRRIAFTGSLRTGLGIQRAAAEVGVKHVTLELGGKNAMIVFPDADLGEVFVGAVRGMNLGFAGQSCGSNSRILVHEAVADRVAAKLAEAFAALAVGDAVRDDTEVGPVISARQLARMIDYVDRGSAAGGRVLTGGSRHAGGTGYFMTPTVIDRVEPANPLFQDEIFGPVVSLVRFSTTEEAVDLANRVRYGLTGSVWTSDLRRAHRVAAALEAGYVWINDSNTHYAGTPFGGYKDSGTGREESLEEVLSYTQTKTVHLSLR